MGRAGLNLYTEASTVHKGNWHFALDKTLALAGSQGHVYGIGEMGELASDMLYLQS